MYHVERDELALARWKSRRLLAVVSLSFGVGETNCSQGSILGAKCYEKGVVYDHKIRCSN